VWPRNWIGFRRGARCSSGTTPGPNGSSARPAISPTTAWIATRTRWRRNKVAIIWVGENGEERIFTYGELLRQVNRCANALKALGLQKGDRVTIYLPKIPEQVVAMLACARIGVIHSVVYSGFSAPALASRIQDAEARVVITADVGYDRGKTINLKGVVDDAVRTCPSVEKVVVVRRESPGVALAAPKEIDWVEWLQTQSAVCQAEALDAETPLYILYTSGTTGKPKGVVHVHGGYMVGTYITTKYVFDLKEEDVYFCVGRPGLGHRPQLHRLWPAAERRDDPHGRRANPTIRTPAAGGISSPATASRFSTPRRRRSGS
jgi:acyl-coenzyme A synthetase/AMP-(fatty) acid ligase